MDRPPQHTIDRMNKAVERSKRHRVALPQGFARDQESKLATTPLATLLRGGGEVRLKTYLTVLMMATAPPHTIKVSPRRLAELLGLRDPDGAGARRVTSALRDLERQGMISRDRVPGHVPEIQVLDPAGTGKAWSDRSPGPHYISLPIFLWERGWFIALSGRAIAALVIITEATARRKNNEGWVDGTRKRQYALSDDTWTRAIRELVGAGLLDVRQQVYSDRGEPRRRNVYALHLERCARFDPGDLSDEQASG